MILWGKRERERERGREGEREKERERGRDCKFSFDQLQCTINSLIY